VSWLDRFRIDILEGVSPEDFDAARAAAGQHPAPRMPALPYTEAEPRWVLLYNHARQGQIDPDTIRRMRTDDLEFLAGGSEVAFGVDDPVLGAEERETRRSEMAKWVANVARARRVLSRRLGWTVGLMAALIGALVAGGFTLLGGLLP